LRGEDRARRCAWVVVSAALATLATPELAFGQVGEQLVLGVSAARAQTRAVAAGVPEQRLSGPLFGIEGRASRWRLHARGEYRQGRLARDGSSGSVRVILAEAGVGIQPVPWVALTAGPRYSSGISAGQGDLLRWRVALHVEAPLIAGLASAFGSIGGSVAGASMDSSEPFRNAGGEIGLRVGGPQRPLWGRLGYRMDRDYLAGGPWEAIETVYLSVGVSVPRNGTPRD